MNWCKFVTNIEKDPNAIVPKITIGQYLELREHVHNCQNCWDSMNRTLDKDKKENNKPFMSEN